MCHSCRSDAIFTAKRSSMSLDVEKMHVRFIDSIGFRTVAVVSLHVGALPLIFWPVFFTNMRFPSTARRMRPLSTPPRICIPASQLRFLPLPSSAYAQASRRSHALFWSKGASTHSPRCGSTWWVRSEREKQLGGKLVPCTVVSRYRSVSSLGGQIAKEDRHDPPDVLKHVWACCECLLKISGESAFPEGRSVEGRSRIGPFSPKYGSPTVDIVRPAPMSQDEQPQRCRLAGALMACALAYVRDRNVGVYV